MIRTYSDLRRLKTFIDRFNYLKLNGLVGSETFGFDRYLNQALYRSQKWRNVRREIIRRDNACDLGIEDHDIYDQIIIHHMNPLTSEQIEDRDPSIFDPEFLICTSTLTHKAIHFSDEKLFPKGLIERRPNDTCPWKG